MRYTLVIIDMQKYFDTSQKKSVIANCRKEIKKAIKTNNHIMFVEYCGCGKTDTRLTNMTKGYPKKSIVTKKWDGGADEVTKKIQEWKLARKNLRVCGVNTDACVYKTVIGLRFNLPKSNIFLVKNACNTSRKTGHTWALKELKKNQRCILETV